MPRHGAARQDLEARFHQRGGATLESRLPIRYIGICRNSEGNPRTETGDRCGNTLPSASWFLGQDSDLDSLACKGGRPTIRRPGRAQSRLRGCHLILSGVGVAAPSSSPPRRRRLPRRGSNPPVHPNLHRLHTMCLARQLVSCPLTGYHSPRRARPDRMAEIHHVRC